MPSYVRDFQEGDTVRVVAQRYGHGIPLGTITTIESVTRSRRNEGEGHYNIRDALRRHLLWALSDDELERVGEEHMSNQETQENIRYLFPGERVAIRDDAPPEYKREANGKHGTVIRIVLNGELSKSNYRIDNEIVIVQWDDKTEQLSYQLTQLDFVDEPTETIFALNLPGRGILYAKDEAQLDEYLIKKGYVPSSIVIYDDAKREELRKLFE